MINGAHVIIYSTDAESDRAFLRDVLGLTNIDVGGGWLIFGLPPSEIAVHPGEANGKHELFFMCEDINAFVDEMRTHGLHCSGVSDEGWGLVKELTLPGGGGIGIYQPRHARPKPMT